MSDGDRSTVFDGIEHDLDGVEVALARLNAGTYFSCETCGAPLDPHALLDHPVARRCAAC